MSSINTTLTNTTPTGQSLTHIPPCPTSDVSSISLGPEFDTFLHNKSGRMAGLDPMMTTGVTTRPRRSITSYTPGQYSYASTTTMIPPVASATSSHHTTRNATGTRITKRVKAEPDRYSGSDGDDGQDHFDDGPEAEAEAVEDNKIEMRRERNRIKQRNLRSEFTCQLSTRMCPSRDATRHSGASDGEHCR